MSESTPTYRLLRFEPETQSIPRCSLMKNFAQRLWQAMKSFPQLSHAMLWLLRKFSKRLIQVPRKNSTWQPLKTQAAILFQPRLRSYRLSCLWAWNKTCILQSHTWSSLHVFQSSVLLFCRKAKHCCIPCGTSETSLSFDSATTVCRPAQWQCNGQPLD